VNEAVNEEWISDKTRFIWDGLKTQRLDRPYIRKNGKLTAATWSEAFDVIAAKVSATSADKIGAIAGDLSSVEEIYAMRELMAALGATSMDCRPENSALDPSLGRASYIFNSTIDGIEDANLLMLIGTNPRKEAAVLNSRIRKRWRTGELKIAVIGEQAELNYDYHYIGAGPESLKQFVAHSKTKSPNPMFIIGEGAFTRKDGKAVLAAAARAAKSLGVVDGDWNAFNILHTAAARVGGLDLGFVPGKDGMDTGEMIRKSEVLFLLGADELDMMERRSGFTVYIGSHGDVGAHHCDVILPGAAYTEKSGTWVNTEGRVQMGQRAGFAPGEAREDWAILRALSEALGHTLSFNSLQELRRKLYEAYPHFADLGNIASGGNSAIDALAARKGGALRKAAFVSKVDDFYLTNPIARSSAVMAECSARALGDYTEAAE